MPISLTSRPAVSVSASTRDPAHAFEDAPDNESEHEGEGPDRQHADELVAEQPEATAHEEAVAIDAAWSGHRREEADGQRTPDAVGEVHGERPDRVIDLELVEAQHAEDHEHPSHETDHRRGGHSDEGTGRCDGHQARQCAVHGHAEVGPYPVPATR